MLALRFLGQTAILADGAQRLVPASRKTRALLAWLALEARPHRRQRLCELLWDVPDDPRAALRWSLAKLRPLLDAPGRLVADRETVALAGDALDVDVLAVRAALAAGLAGRGVADLQALLDRLAGPFLADSELPACPEFDAWIIAVRHEMQAAETAIAEALLLHDLPAATRLRLIDRLLALSPYDAALHARRIALLGETGSPADAARAAEAASARLAEAGLGPLPRTQPAPTAPSQLPPGVLAAVLVLPFEAGGDMVPAALAASLLSGGVADALARFRSLQVTALTAAPADPLAALRSTGAGYAVSGLVLVAGDRVRVRYRLIDAASGAAAWSGDIDAPLGDLMALEADLTTAIANALEPRIRFGEARAAARRPLGAAEPRDLFLRALAEFVGGGDHEAAADLLAGAIAIDPRFALAGAFLPWAAMQSGRIADEAQRRHFADMARRAAHDAPDDVIVQAMAGLGLVLLDHDFDGGLAVIDRAVQLNPGAMFAWMAHGWAALHGGDDAAALASFDRAEALGGADITDNSVNAGRAIACFQAGDLDAAGRWARRALARMQTGLEGLRAAIAVAVEQGDLATARAHAAELRRRAPRERARRARLLPFRNRRTSDRLFAAFVAAGIPE